MIKAHHPIYTVYAAEGDMTFIMQDHYKISYGNNGEYEELLRSTEVIGFHYGKPDAHSTENPKLKAEY